MGGRARRTPEEDVDLVYSRFNHPNAEILEDQILPLEPGAVGAVAFNSGMAAIMTALLAVLQPGDAVLYTVPIYGGTQTLIQGFLQPFGIQGVAVQAGRADSIDEAIRNTKNLRVILVESPANPTILMTDIKRVCATAAKAGAPEKRPLVMVDNTFLGPAWQHALELGADVSLYSATKYLGGFSDIIGGIALAKDAALIGKIKSKRSLFGNILQPDECWILNTRLPTVTLRMNHQSRSAQLIAESLAGHPKIAKVYYPTLFEDPEQVRIFNEQCTGPGGLVSLDLKGGKSAAFDLLRYLRLARNAVSLGGVETLACHPRSTTHSAWSAQDLDAAGIGEGLVRISCGIEDWQQALERV